jgi:hypothetical protein
MLLLYHFLLWISLGMVWCSSPLSYFLENQPACSSSLLKDDSQFPILMQMSTSAKYFFSSLGEIKTTFTNGTDLQLDNTGYLGENPNLLIFIFFIFFIFIIIFLSCCCQAFCIRKLQLCYRCCRIDLEETKPTNFEKYCLLTCLILTIILMGLVIALMILNHDMNLGYENSFCNLNNLPIQILSPQNLSSYAKNRKERENLNWRGSIQLSEDLSKAAKIFPIFKENKDLKKLSEIKTEELLANVDQFKQIYLVNALEPYQNSKLTNPNPLSTQKGLRSSILDKWGPGSNEGTFLYPIQLEVTSRRSFVEQIERFGNEAGELDKKLDEFKNVYEESAKNIGQFGVNLSLAIKSQVKMLENNKKTIERVETIPYLLAVLNGFPGMLIIFGFVMIVCCKCKCFNIFLHCSWMISFFLVLIMTLSAFHLFILGHSMSQSCNLLEDAFKNQKDYLKAMKEFNWQESDIISSSFCLFEKKNLSFFYNFESYLEKPNEMYNNLQYLILKQMDFANSDLTIQKLKDFKVNYAEFAGEPISPDHPTNVLMKLNLWSNSESLDSLQEKQGFCAITTDQYVFKETDCVYKKK